MNKKGKNKKGKVPNPIPFQEEKSSDKVEDLGKKGDQPEDIVVPAGDEPAEVNIIGDIVPKLEEKVESVEEKRVPEIVSENVTSYVDLKDEESPKKPKRNRGKKKKGKDDDFEDNLEEKTKETDTKPVEETKVDITEPEKETEESPVIIPSARKKKNKKKNMEQKAEEQVLPDQEILNIQPATEIKESEANESIPELKPELSDQETKPSKKKNKKKKLNDSERSDKEEFSCTSAFHKILDNTEEPLEIKPEGKTDDSILFLGEVNPEKDNANVSLVLNVEDTPVDVIEGTSTLMKDQDEIKVTPDNKNKKKNKKDKKQALKINDISQLVDVKLDQIPTLKEVEIAAQSVAVETMKEISITLKEVAESPKPSDDLSPKPKAKIAKPVEKKRKGKHDTQTFESIDKDISEPLKLDEKFILDKPVDAEIKAMDDDKASQIEPQATQSEIASDFTSMAPTEDEKLMAQEFELIAEKAMGKKRKKESKMHKTLEIGSVTLEQKMETSIKKSNSKEEINKEQLAVITEILTPQIDQQEFIIKSEKSDTPFAIDTVKEAKDLKQTIEKPEFKGNILLTPENVAEEKEFIKIKDTSQQTEDRQKPGKKRKKSPKPPTKTEIVTERPLTPKPEEIAKEPFITEEFTQQSLAEKIDASNITRMYDIEISSIQAAESEGTAIDTIPEITYPRASSQQLCDDNNNTVITEIFSSEVSTPDTPYVQKCPSPSPKKYEETKTAPKEEKTDIKSKMMEVNQDMEELRLSIERSLAELTSIEKSEDTIEKEFEASKAKVENISSLLYETGESPKPTVSDKAQQMEQTASKEVFIGKHLDGSNIIVVSDDQKFRKFGENQGIITKENPFEALGESKILESINIPIAEVQPMPPAADIFCDKKSLIEGPKVLEGKLPPVPFSEIEEKGIEIIEAEKKYTELKPKETPLEVPPTCPARKDNKGKHKKKKGKQEAQTTATPSTQSSTPASTQSQTIQETKKEGTTESKSETKAESKDKGQNKEKGKQQDSNIHSQEDEYSATDYEPIEDFEDALTSSVDDVNKSFEMIVKESQEQNNPKINIIAPDEEKKTVSPPKNLLGHPDIPVRSNRMDFKKEKDKLPNEITARVKIKDTVEVERKQSKNTQTITKMKEFTKDYKMDDNEDFVYKYSFRKVFLQSACHLCKKDLKGSRVPCSYCSLLFYCSNKHKDEDWPQHQALCFAVSTIVHLKDQKHIYADAKNLTGHDYRLIRMQMIVSCEKVLKRRLVPWEQEALLYPRICAHVACREWRQSKLTDCQGCGQISYCVDNPDHFPKAHSRWCKSYSLYEKLVSYQQTKGRLEPKIPTKVLQEPQQVPEKINEVLASMYEEKIDINDIQYAALTQLATAPLTAAYCHQLCKNKPTSTNGVYKKTSFTIHVVGAELQFEADALNKWEVFFLHLRPDLQELRVVLINYNLNPSNLPLELLGKIKLCENCRQNKRRVLFSFQDKRTYTEYKSSEEFVLPDLVCAFNPSIQRSSVYNGKDPWPTTINVILKLKVPFIITAYTITELHKDCIRIKESSESGYNFIAEPKYNNFASVRPDRNFISDEEMPLLFKNYCYAVLSG